jgi:hypothetical protein
MNYEDFFDEAAKRKLSITFDNVEETHGNLLNNEALFHLPLLAITVLVLAKGRKKPQLSQIGQIVGDCFQRSFTGFKGSSQHLGWSANLRMRTISALHFLETANLVWLNTATNTLEATKLGIKVVNKALSEDGNLSYTLALIQNSYKNICNEKQIEMNLI